MWPRHSTGPIQISQCPKSLGRALCLYFLLHYHMPTNLFVFLFEHFLRIIFLQSVTLFTGWTCPLPPSAPSPSLCPPPPSPILPPVTWSPLPQHCSHHHT